MKENIENILEEKINLLKELKENGYSDQMIRISDMIVESITNGHKLLIAGNGGSAADAQHIAAEIVGRFELERKGYAAIALTTDTSILTAVGNDYGYDDVFSRQVEGLGQEGDVFLGISTSGNSKNIIKAIEKCREQGVKVIGFTGHTGGKMADMCDECLIVNGPNTARIQENHMMSYHIMCQIIERKVKEYFGD